MAHRSDSSGKSMKKRRDTISIEELLGGDFGAMSLLRGSGELMTVNDQMAQVEEQRREQIALDVVAAAEEEKEHQEQQLSKSPSKRNASLFLSRLSSSNNSKGSLVKASPRRGSLVSPRPSSGTGGSPRTSKHKLGRDRVDLFKDSLVDIMAFQKQVYPNLAVPCIVNFLTEEVLRLGGMKTQGIFSNSVGKDLIGSLVHSISKAKVYGNYKLKSKDPNVPASLLKQWLRDLPVPLFSDYDACLKAAERKKPDQNDFIGLLGRMDPTHRELVLYISQFLKQVAHADNVPTTKMTLKNLAGVFVPSFLRCDTEDLNLIVKNQPLEQVFVMRLLECLDDDQFHQQLKERLFAQSKPKSRRRRRTHADAGGAPN